VQLRESERAQAAKNAVAWYRHGDRDRALASVERAQATPDPSSRLAADSTLLKARILDELGQHEQSLAHYRYLRERHPDVLRGQTVPDAALLALPDATTPPTGELDVPEPRYPQEASWADVGGVVHVRFRVGERGRPEAIHVVGPAHPLLASLAIEATARTRVRGREAQQRELGHSRDLLFQFEAKPVPARIGTADRIQEGES
jgi:TonB family protein